VAAIPLFFGAGQALNQPTQLFRQRCFHNIAGLFAQLSADSPENPIVAHGA
jgi:hypothetical protein